MAILQNIPPGKKYSRIISLVPSQTELLFHLNLENEVIGLTKFCIHPEKWFRNKTRVGGTKSIHFQTIDQLSPDLIIANKEENVKEQVEKLAEKFDVWITEVNNLSDALKMISDIGKLTGRDEVAFKLSTQIKDKFEKLKKIISPEKRIRAAYFIWKDPYMVAGGSTFINEMLEYCGLENMFAHKSRYPQITLNEIKENNCLLILLSSEPYPFKEKHKEEMQKMFPAIKIELADGEMFSWYGSRLLKSADYFESLFKID